MGDNASLTCVFPNNVTNVQWVINTTQYNSTKIDFINCISQLTIINISTNYNMTLVKCQIYVNETWMIQAQKMIILEGMNVICN